MKKIGLITLCAMCAVLLASCGKNYKDFVGTWGVEKIEYYNIDYAGNPIPATIASYTFNPEDIDNGIQLIFRADKTGELRDSDVDTIWLWNDEINGFDTTYIYNPDTTLVYTFTYSYDNGGSALYMTMKYTYPYVYTRTFMMKVYDLTDNSFSYENEYQLNYMERAYLKRLSNTPTKATSKSKVARPRKEGSFLSGR